MCRKLRKQKNIRTPGAGAILPFTSNWYKLPDMGAGNKMQILWKQCSFNHE